MRLACRPRRGLRASLRPFSRDRDGAAAVEFAIVSLPFLLLILTIIQMGIYYMAQSALDAGVIQTADTLVNMFYTSNTPVIPNLNALVASKAGGMIQNTPTTLYVELQPLSALSAASVPIGDTVNAGSARSLLALRAEAKVTGVVPGFQKLLVVKSTALVRRQGQ